MCVLCLTLEYIVYNKTDLKVNRSYGPHVGAWLHANSSGTLTHRGMGGDGGGGVA